MRSLHVRSLQLAGVMLAAAGCAALTGCKARQPELTYMQAYEQKLYSEALTKAAPVAESKTAPGAERAALVAGMSAQALGQTQDATRYLTPLKASTNKEIAGRARTSLGLLAASKGDNQQASVLLSTGAEQLDGDDAARAKMHAGAAMEKIGLQEMAMRQYQAGVNEADDPALRAMLRDRTKPAPFYVQAGAYSTKAQADAEVKRIARSVIRAGQPTPKVVAVTSSTGKRLYSVQIGPYRDAAAARSGMAAMQQLGVKSGTVTRRRDG